jgi:hypothetical protein
MQELPEPQWFRDTRAGHFQNFRTRPDRAVRDFSRGDAGWSSPVARQAHNLKVVGSNPAPATTFTEH